MCNVPFHVPHVSKRWGVIKNFVPNLQNRGAALDRALFWLHACIRGSVSNSELVSNCSTFNQLEFRCWYKTVNRLSSLTCLMVSTTLCSLSISKIRCNLRQWWFHLWRAQFWGSRRENIEIILQYYAFVSNLDASGSQGRTGASGGCAYEPTGRLYTLYVQPTGTGTMYTWMWYVTNLQCAMCSLDCCSA